MEEKKLISSIQKGNTKKFSILIQPYMEKIYHISLNITRNHHDAEEAVQETMIKAYRYIKNFKSNSSFYTWIYRITVNTSINLVNKRNKDRNKNSYLDNIDDTISDNFSSPIKSLEINELQNRINKIINLLSPKLRSAISLIVFEKMPVQQAAKILEINVKTLTWRLFQARKIIKEKLK